MTPTKDPASLAVACQVDQVCDYFEEHWSAPDRPRVEALLTRQPAHLRGELLLALLPVELELLAREGQTPSEADCRARFPGLESVVRDVFAQRHSGETSILPTDVPPPHLGANNEIQPARTIGRFVVLGVLGEGAFGTVYRARDPRLDRDVAIKVPRLDALGDHFDVERFLREAKTTASVRHPNVCPVYEADVENGRPYIVMALVVGEPLDRFLAANGSLLPAKQVALITRRIALALQTAHEKGIVHRDLKPANVMFDRERQDVVVMDFGLARGPRLEDAAATQSGVIMGTPAYMAPEQARGAARSVGPAADVYSLGVMLYEMLTGRRPFSGTVAEVLGQILHVEPERPSEVRPGVDPRLEAICLKAMAKTPVARYGSMREFARALDAWLRTPTGQGNETADVRRVSAAIGARSQQVIAAAQEQKPQTVVGKVRIWAPRLVLVLLALLLGGGTALPGIVFVSRTPTVTVMVVIDGLDPKDESFSFVLDGKKLPAAKLKKTIELKVGDHELVVSRGKEECRRYRFVVLGGRDPGIQVTELRPGLVDPDRAAAEWVLSVGGHVRVAEPDRVPSHYPDITRLPVIEKAEQLPSKPFRLVGFWKLHEHGTDEAMKRFAGLKGLRWIDLTGSPLTDEGLKTLSEHKGLVFLELRNVERLTDQGLRHVAKLVRLQALVLSENQMTDDGLAPLAGLTDLRRLSLAAPRFTGAGLKHFHKLPKLDHLHLGGRGVTQQGLAALPGLAHVTVLHLSEGVEVTDAVLKHVAGMGELVDVSLGGRKVTNDGLAHLSKLANLRTLRIGVPQVSDDGLRHLAKLSQLETLQVVDSQVTGAGLKHLSKLGKLRALLLYDCPVANAGLNGATVLERLVALELVRTKVTDESLGTLGKLSKLTFLSLDGSPVSDEGLRALQKALPKCTITPQPKPSDDPDRAAAEWVLSVGGSVRVAEPDRVPSDSQALSELPMLDKEEKLPQKQFRLVEFGNLRERGTDAEMSRFARLSSLRGIDLRGSPITDEGLKTLAQHKGLVCLELANAAKVTDRGTRHLSEFTRLQSLVLSGTQVTDDGLAPLAVLTELRYFSLAAPKFTGSGLKHFHKLGQLRTVLTGGPGLTDEGLAALPGLPHVTALHVGEADQVSDAGLKHLAGLSHLADASLSSRKVTNDGLAHLAKLENLSTLRIGFPQVTDDGLRHLAGLWRLSTLQIGHSRMTGAGLKHLKKLGQLRVLLLDDCPVTDDGLDGAVVLERLLALDLTRTKVSDESLGTLGKLRKLRSLNLSGSPVSADGLRKLTKALPNCQISPKPK